MAVYEATYSHIPVWETMCNGVAVMRRKSDSYLNATQILKVAGIEKGRRTKILDKDVASGVHEKVQGGFSKYQGTWVPFDRGLQIALEYKVDAFIRSILTPNPSDLPIVPKPLREQRPPLFVCPPMDSHQSPTAGEMLTVLQKKPSNDPMAVWRRVFQSLIVSNNFSAIERALELPDIHIDCFVDDENNTALHWAAVMARPELIEMLVARGANVCLRNAAGRTPLMSIVYHHDGHSAECFADMLRILGPDSLPTPDFDRRSVLHHIALTSEFPCWIPHALYYLAVLFEVFPVHAEAIFFFVDNNGFSALDIAISIGNPQFCSRLESFNPSRKILKPSLACIAAVDLSCTLKSLK